MTKETLKAYDEDMERLSRMVDEAKRIGVSPIGVAVLASYGAVVTTLVAVINASGFEEEFSAKVQTLVDLSGTALGAYVKRNETLTGDMDLDKVIG